MMTLCSITKNGTIKSRAYWFNLGILSKPNAMWSQISSKPHRWGTRVLYGRQKGDVKIVYILLICPVRTGDCSLNCGSVIMRQVLRREFINHCLDSEQFLCEIWTITTQECCQFKTTWIKKKTITHGKLFLL